MRTILILTYLLAFPAIISAQSDFKTLDQKTYDFFTKGDYRNLKKAADSLLAAGSDYYYLRMRLGICAFNKKLYSTATSNLIKALEFSSLDTIAREYIYYSYLLSGRNADSKLYLLSLPADKKNQNLRSIQKTGSISLFAGSGLSGSDVFLYTNNSLNYEAVKSIFNLNAGIETFFLKRFKATLVYTNLRKTGTIVFPG